MLDKCPGTARKRLLTMDAERWRAACRGPRRLPSRDEGAKNPVVAATGAFGGISNGPGARVLSAGDHCSRSPAGIALERSGTTPI